MGRMKGTLTAVTAAKPTTESLRTTIPSFVVSQMDLVAKDNLDWKVDKIDNEWVAVFRKVAPAD